MYFLKYKTPINSKIHQYLYTTKKEENATNSNCKVSSTVKYIIISELENAYYTLGEIHF